MKLIDSGLRASVLNLYSQKLADMGVLLELPGIRLGRRGLGDHTDNALIVALQQGLIQRDARILGDVLGNILKQTHLAPQLRRGSPDGHKMSQRTSQLIVPETMC